MPQQQPSFVPKTFVPDNSYIRNLVDQVSREMDIDPQLIHKIVETESSYNPKARSPKGAVGLMQLMPLISQHYNVTNPEDPYENLKGGISFLKDLIKKYEGDVEKAVAAYNAGEPTVNKWIRNESQLPTETKNYLSKVLPPAQSQTFVPKTFVPDEPQKEKGFIKRTWDWLWEPRESVKPYANLITNITVPGAIKNKSVQDFYSDLGTSLLTPGNLILTALTGGEYAAGRAGLNAIASGLRALNQLGSAGLAAEGGIKVATGDTLGERAAGALQAGLGVLGIHNRPPLGTRNLDPRPIEIKLPEVLPKIPEEITSFPKLIESRKPIGLLPERSSASPRFFAGRGGITDAEMQYLFESTLPAVRPLIQMHPRSNIVLGKSGEFIGSPTLKPSELTELIDVGPEIAANYGPAWQGRFLDPAQENEAFRSLIPERLRSVGPITGVPTRPFSKQPLSKLQYPEGGAIVNPPEPQIKQQFRVDVIEPEFSKAFRKQENVVASEQKPKSLNLNDYFIPENLKPTSFKLWKKGLLKNEDFTIKDLKPEVRKKIEELKISDFDEIMELHAGLPPKLPRSLTDTIKRAKTAFKNLQKPVPPVTKPSVEGVPGKILQALQEATPIRKRQDEIYSIERAKRFSAAEKIDIKDEESAYRYLGKMAGEMPKVTIESIRPKLTQADVNKAFAQIGNSGLLPGEKLRAVTGLSKILGEYGGHVPQPNEMDALRKVFGKEFTNQLGELFGGFGALPIKKKIITEFVNLPRAIKSAFDFSAPFRQGLGAITRKEFWNSFDDMFKAFGSEKAYKLIIDSIKDDPLYPLARKFNLQITEMGRNLSSREEAFISRWAEKVPLVARSGRAYTAFLDKTRFDLFKSLLKDAKNSGLNVEKDPILIQRIVDYINNATGRGRLGELGEKNALALANVFFSPRLIASRIKMLDPRKYITEDPFIRKQYLRSLFGIAALGTTMTTIGKLSGADISEDPTSADFGKLKFGESRIDPYGGFQQYIVAASRLTSGVNKIYNDPYHNPSRYDPKNPINVIESFARTKLSPVANFIYTLISGVNFRGEKSEIPAEVIDLYVPLIASDIYELAKEDPNLLPVITPLVMVGMGSQTYGESSLARDIAQTLNLVEAQRRKR